MRSTLAASLGILLSVMRVTSQPDVSPVLPEKPCLSSRPYEASSDGKKVECHTSPWPPVLSSVGYNVTSLTVKGLKQHSLEAKNLTSLTHLEVTDGHLSEVSRDVFSGLLQLDTLILSRNLLTELPTDVFADNKHLKHLVLSGNPIKLPSSGPFLRSESLHYLDLSNCNVSKLPPDVFKGLPQLRELHIGSNLLLEYPGDALKPLSSLQKVFHDEYDAGSGLPSSVAHALYISFMCAAAFFLLIVGYKAVLLVIKSVRCKGWSWQRYYFLMGNRKLVPRQMETMPMAAQNEERPPPSLRSHQLQRRNLPALPSGSWTPPRSFRSDSESSIPHVYESLYANNEYHVPVHSLGYEPILRTIIPKGLQKPTEGRAPRDIYMVLGN